MDPREETAVPPAASSHRRDDPANCHALSRPLVFALLTCAAALALIGFTAELLYAQGKLSPDATAFLSLSAEHNLPTWYATCLLFWCSLSLVETGLSARARAQPHAHTWLFLAAGFLVMSLDEAVEIHELLGGLVEGRGVLYFSWVIPAAALVVAVAAICVPFLRALPGATRHRFIAAGALYVGGALLMELPLGLWTERHGADNLTYAVLDLVEETLELAGASLFIAALEAHQRALSAGRAPR